MTGYVRERVKEMENELWAESDRLRHLLDKPPAGFTEADKLWTAKLIVLNNAAIGGLMGYRLSADDLERKAGEA